MAKAIATVRIMPASPEIELESLEKKSLEKIKSFNDNGETKVKKEPVAFGLKSINITFVMDEARGSPDPVAEEIAEFEEVASAEVIDVRRAIG
ncbi:elongation factor 1-beta [Candidatus Woesearchaeota archaeon]|nr:elongation factor 1-beta [Candidatus Woesearchaeota archaeon]